MKRLGLFIGVSAVSLGTGVGVAHAQWLHSRVLDQGEVGVGLSHSIATSGTIFDQNEERRAVNDFVRDQFVAIAMAMGAPPGTPPPDVNGWDVTTMVTQLDLAYGLVDGLELGASLPFVSNDRSGTVAFGPMVVLDNEHAEAGLGDISVRAVYAQRLDAASVGGGLRWKIPTGREADTFDPRSGFTAPQDVPLGSGQTDLGAHAFASARFGDLVTEVTAGYILRFAGAYTPMGVEVKPGNVLHASLGVAYWILEPLALEVAALSYLSGEREVAGVSAPDTDSWAFTVAPGILFQPMEGLLLFARGRGNRLGAQGFEFNPGSGPGYVPTGLPVLGKNENGGGFAFTLGVEYTVAM